jgi:hypothetical protein
MATTMQDLAVVTLTTEIAPAVSSYRQIYNETSESDVLVELRANVQELEDLHGRLQFAMRELQGLMKR